MTASGASHPASAPPTPRCWCAAPDPECAHVYAAPPIGETRLEWPVGMSYHRELHRCRGCGHVVSVCAIDLARLYDGAYVSATYGDSDRLHQAYERIRALPKSQSDNADRVERVDRFGRMRIAHDEPPTLLDIGSGLGVFPAVMCERGWSVLAVDPDARAAAHLAELGLDTVCADFHELPPVRSFDLVSFNKVLEHVYEPGPMLARTGVFLFPGGTVYVELPDGEAAFEEGPGREELFIEHLHAFSPTSLTALAAASGFRVLDLRRLREPSGKYTLAAFLEEDVR